MILLTCTAGLVVFIDTIAAVGLSFTSFHHYSASLLILIFIAFFIDLPAMVIALRKPKKAAALVVVGAGALFLYIVLYFVHIRQLPTEKVALQAIYFLVPKLALAAEMFGLDWINRTGISHKKC